MRNISFSLTEQQFLDGSKDVTRRLGWEYLKVGDRLMGCRKCMGRKAGEPLVRLGEIEVVSVRRETLLQLVRAPKYGWDECRREGFPQMGPWEFIEFFISSHAKCTAYTTVTRIEFRRL